MSLRLTDPEYRPISLVGAIQVVVIIAGVLLTSAMLKLYGDGEDLLPLAHYNQAPIWLRHYGFVLPLK